MSSRPSPAREALPVAVVTGGGGGLGRAICRRLARGGMAVAVWDRDKAAAARVVQELQDDGLRSVADEVDVTDVAQVRARMAALNGALGTPTVLVNNAGVAVMGPFADLVARDFEACLSVNLMGTVHCTQAFVAGLGGGSGVVVNLASVAGLTGIAGGAAYCASKGAVVALTRALAVELAPSVRVNAVCPATVLTELSRPLLAERGDGDAEVGERLTAGRYPLGRLGTPEEVAASVAFLAGPDSGFVTGTALALDGGMLAR